jgi:hypothetical protein
MPYAPKGATGDKKITWSSSLCNHRQPRTTRLSDINVALSNLFTYKHKAKIYCKNRTKRLPK